MHIYEYNIHIYMYAYLNTTPVVRRRKAFSSSDDMRKAFLLLTTCEKPVLLLTTCEKPFLLKEPLFSQFFFF